MSFNEQIPVIVVSALTMTLLFDVLALPLGFADRRGYMSPFKILKRYMSNMLGFILLCICVPGLILSIMVCFLRSWADNQVILALIFVFLAGAVLGAFLSSDTVEVNNAGA